MGVAIRLKRTGTTKQGHFRVVVTDVRAPRDGRFIEELGAYHPRTEPATLNLNAERVQYWLSKGAQPTVPVKALIKKAGIK